MCVLFPENENVVMSRPTIKDVAELAGVSQSTVSRALSAPEIVKEETVKRVREAARSGVRQAVDYGRAA